MTAGDECRVGIRTLQRFPARWLFSKKNLNDSFSQKVFQILVFQADYLFL